MLSACGAEKSDHVSARSSVSGEAPSNDAVAQASGGEIAAIVGSSCAAVGASGGSGIVVAVPARGYWTSTNIYLYKGQQAHYEATGKWTIWDGVTAPFGAKGGDGLTHFEGCLKGSLVAKVGLSLDGKRLCLGESGDVVAAENGIVYLAMNDNSSPSYHAGQLEVTLTGDGTAAPTVPAAAAPTYDFCGASSGWVELQTAGGLILTVPAALAAASQPRLGASLATLDKIYAKAVELFGGEKPFGGEPLRLYPDFAVRSRGWIIAGNPLLYDPLNLNAKTPSAMKILDLNAPGSKLFDLVRAIGVDVSRGHGVRYQPNDASAQAWGGLFAAYVGETVTLGAWPEELCGGQAAQEASGTFAEFKADPWLQLCFLSNLQKIHGWPLFTRFFSALPTDAATDLAAGASAETVWQWLYERLSTAAGQDLSADFARFKIPVAVPLRL